MSYDFSMSAGPRVCKHCGEEIPDVECEEESRSLGCTSNVGPMFRHCLGATGVTQFDGMLGRDALPILEAGIERMRLDRNLLEEMNPANGWGSYDGALRTLQKLREWCTSTPEHTISIWY